MNEANKGYSPLPFPFGRVPRHHLRIDFIDVGFQEPRVDCAQPVAVAPVVDAVDPLTNDRPELRADSFSDDRRIELQSGKQHIAIRRCFPETVPYFEHLLFREAVERETLPDSAS